MSFQQDISVDEALNLILADIEVLPGEDVPIESALNRVLAVPIAAQDQLPPFANSAMDGFALRSHDVALATSDEPARLRVIGEVAAGSSPDVVVAPGSAVRIMTGAPIPIGADAVVPVEDTSESRSQRMEPLPTQVAIFRSVGAGDYVRPAGEDVQVGDVVLSPGTRIRSQEIGLMASLGRKEVTVVRKPRVGILATGDELASLDEPLAPGKIRNSNSYAQAAQTVEAGGVPIMLGVARDSLTDLRERLSEGVEREIDLFVSSAGVSVGNYDVVKHLLEKEGQVRFWRVRMRPGKPLTFGSYRNIHYFGLPGNPVSAMVSFERFVRPSLLRMGGFANVSRPTVEVYTEAKIHSDGRESYVRAVVHKAGERYLATPTGAQGSHMMTSLSEANALIIVPEGLTSVEPGAALTAMMLDWPGSVF